MRTLSKLSFLQWRNTIYQGVLLQSVYGQLPPRSWSTIGCHYSPQSLSSAAIRIHHELPPRSWSTTTARCQHDRGSAIFVTTSQHDTESAILDPPLRSLIRDPQVVLHDVAKLRVIQVFMSLRHAWSLVNWLLCSGFIDKYNWVSSA